MRRPCCSLVACLALLAGIVATVLWPSGGLQASTRSDACPAYSQDGATSVDQGSDPWAVNHRPPPPRPTGSPREALLRLLLGRRPAVLRRRLPRGCRPEALRRRHPPVPRLLPPRRAHSRPDSLSSTPRWWFSTAIYSKSRIRFAPLTHPGRGASFLSPRSSPPGRSARSCRRPPP